jgi:hypothetical protein
LDSSGAGSELPVPMPAGDFQAHRAAYARWYAARERWYSQHGNALLDPAFEVPDEPFDAACVVIRRITIRVIMAAWTYRREHLARHGVTVEQAEEALLDPGCVVLDPDPAARPGRSWGAHGWLQP